ncbi:formate/nitrite transporter family protein [Salinimicrobium terrae]|uniref:formate/nitrite transporter family protein n=1 Tax=Salinimicrobium terrae TaxID=470866 RepID=UPI0004248723|nr:formate/nitrite transporter family protein [Salinimicrobium terrae]
MTKENFSDTDKQESEERKSPTAKVIHDSIFIEALSELSRSSSALFWSGLAAGLSMGFSMISEGLLRANLPDVEWRVLISNLGYSVGFLIVILGKQQLFTENTLTPVLPLLQRRDLKTFWQVLRLWGIVLIANLIGAVIIAFVASKSQVFDPHVQEAFKEIGKMAMKPSFEVTLLRGVFAGWLIALIVWLLPYAQTARIWVIIIITYIIGIGHLSHSIAGSVEVFTLAFMEQTSWGNALINFTIPALIGNIIGGVAIVAVLNHAQVKADS